MSTEIVRKQLLVSTSALNIPLGCTPSLRRVREACSAAKLLRNRLLREHARVREYIENLRQKQMYDDDTEDDDKDPLLGAAVDANLNKSSRAEFVFLAEMMVMEKLVLPLLLAHGMKFSESLLPQLLKLLVAMLQPIPRFSANETLQHDLLKRTKQRCGTDDFFSLLVQSVAPIAEKRAAGNLQRDDVVLLEVVLSLVALLLDGRPQDMENIIGSFCRNHGIEFLLVVINQNYSKMQQRHEHGSATKAAQDGEAADADDEEAESEQSLQIVLGEDNTAAQTLLLNDSIPLTAGGETLNEEVQKTSLAADEPEAFLGEDDENSDDEDDEDEHEQELHIRDAVAEIEKELEEKVLDLLESEEQLWKWNCLAMASVASVFNGVLPMELAQLSFLGDMNAYSPEQLLGFMNGGNHFRECKKVADSWRFVARSRHGAMHSNSILVRIDPNNRPGTVGGHPIGTVSSLFGTRRKDPLENVKDMDLRKRGRFVKGMFQDSTPRSDLPLPTKILLSQQSQSFLCLGFEPLNTMTWPKIQAISRNVEQTVKEDQEAASGFKNSGEGMEITSSLGPQLYQEFTNVLHYMSICGNLLHYTREVARLMKQDKVPFSSPHFQQQWQSVSSIISLDHLDGGFAVLRSFLKCRDLRRRCDVLRVVSYLAELLLMLNLILEKEVVDDPAVDVAAHALASAVLYKEENIKTMFDLLNEYASRSLSAAKAQSLTLFVFAVFQLMERCSYNGSLLLPKRAKRNATMTEVGDDGHEADDNDAESVDSALLNQMEKSMVEQMADMIDDGTTSSSSSSSVVSGGGTRHPVTPDHQDDGTLDAAEAQVDGNTAVPAAQEEGGETAQAPEVAQEVEESNNNADSANARPRDVSGGRDPSEGHPPSVTSLVSSKRTTLSAISSEREVAIGGYYGRLATPKNVGLLYSALRYWRINDADVNLGLTYLMEGLTKEGCETVFFNVAFLLLFRDVIVDGKRTHAPLYAICDRLVYDFFNPSFARALDFRSQSLFDEQDANVLTGSQSFLGFEVALRCARSLFNFAAGDYDVLEEKAMPHLMDYTAIPLEGSSDPEHQMNSESAVVAVEPDHSEDAGVEPQRETEEREQPGKKKTRHRRRHQQRSDDDDDNGDGRQKPKRGRREEPTLPPEERVITDAAAEEEDRVFQALMAAIVSPPSRSHGAATTAVAVADGNEHEAALLS